MHTQDKTLTFRRSNVDYVSTLLSDYFTPLRNYRVRFKVVCDVMNFTLDGSKGSKGQGQIVEKEYLENDVL